MFVEIIRFIIVLAGAVGGVYATNYISLPKEFAMSRIVAIIFFMLLGSLVGYLVGGIAGRRLYKSLLWAERAIQKVPLPELIAGIAGLVVGLLLAFLVSLPIWLLPPAWALVRLFAFVLLYVTLGASGMRIATRKWKDMEYDGDSAGGVGALLKGKRSSGGGATTKLLDTNILIDGRITDICATGFVEGRLVVPRFVLAELQAIADSDDALRRNRGRRGLDVLQALQSDPDIDLSFTDNDFAQVPHVDAKLVKLAKEMGAVILTNDYNLNKVATIEGVQILNINELANAVKTALLAGEELVLKLHKTGKEPGQGIGYLDDGTMVVVDGGAKLLGKMVVSEVTGVLQTPAGRMVFAKLKNEAATA